MKKPLLLLIISSLLLALSVACNNPFMEAIIGRDGKEQPETDLPPELLPASERWDKFVADDATATLEYSVDADEVCTIIVDGDPEPNNETDGWNRFKVNANYSYTAKANTYYIYEFEAWTESGTRELNIQYYNNWADDGNTLGEYGLSINSSRQTYKIFGNQIPKGGIWQVEFQCADQLGTFYVKMISITKYDPEQLPASQRWFKWVADDSTATLVLLVGSDDVAAITVGDTPEPNSETDGWNRWKASANYSYPAEASTRYIYEFEAWTESDDGNRTLGFQYYYDEASGDFILIDVEITETRTTYTIQGQVIPKGGIRQLQFQCADQTGKFYVKMRSITKY